MNMCAGVPMCIIVYSALTSESLVSHRKLIGANFVAAAAVLDRAPGLLCNNLFVAVS